MGYGLRFPSTFQIPGIIIPNFCVALRDGDTCTIKIETLLYFIRERVRNMERILVPDDWVDLLLDDIYHPDWSFLANIRIPFQDCELNKTAASHYRFIGPTRTFMEKAAILPASKTSDAAEVCSMNLSPAQENVKKEVEGWIDGYKPSSSIIPSRNFILFLHGPARKERSSPVSSLFSSSSRGNSTSRSRPPTRESSPYARASRQPARENSPYPSVIGEGSNLRQGSHPSLHGQSRLRLSNSDDTVSTDKQDSSVPLSQAFAQGHSIEGPSLHPEPEITPSVSFPQVSEQESSLYPGPEPIDNAGSAALLEAVCSGQGLTAVLVAAQKRSLGTQASFADQFDDFKNAVALLVALEFEMPQKETELFTPRSFMTAEGTVELNMGDILGVIGWTGGSFVRKARIYPWSEFVSGTSWGKPVPRKWSPKKLLPCCLTFSHFL